MMPQFAKDNIVFTAYSQQLKDYFTLKGYLPKTQAEFDFLMDIRIIYIIICFNS